MIYQLPNGRVIHLSLEQYLDMSDEELHELACLGDQFTSDPVDPFYKSALHTSNNKSKKPDEVPEIDKEQGLDEISDIEKFQDKYFRPDDI
jgi:hypothetical protein